MDEAQFAHYSAAGRGRVPVWAPTAEAVELVLFDAAGNRTDTVPMQPCGQWWLAPAALGPGTNYAYRVDGQGPFPDPRASFFPAGPNHYSQTVEAAPSDRPLPVLGRVFYELHVGTFTPAGTLDAAIEKLDYLAELGVEVIELMPLAQFQGEHGWGYDGVGIYGVHAAYGGPAALARFIAAAHARSLAVCADLVLNHLGPLGNYTTQFGPYFTEANPTPWGAGFNLSGPDSLPVREYLIGAALHYFDTFGVDALRLDAVHAIRDDSPTHLLAELSDRVRRLEDRRGAPLTLIAESDLNDITMITPTAAGGMGMDGQWDDDVHHALHAAFTGETQGYYADFDRPEALAKVYDSVFYHDGTYSSFRGRDWGAPVPPDFDRSRFVVFSSNHDQVGNRAVGDRPQHQLSAGQSAAMAAMVVLSPFTPMLFMGEEFGATTPFQFFTDFPPEFGAAVSAGRKAEFASHGWAEAVIPDPQSPATLAASKLAWEDRSTPAGARMEKWYRDIIALRAKARPTRARIVHVGKSWVLVTDAWLVWVNRGDFTVTDGTICGPDSVAEAVAACAAAAPSAPPDGAPTPAWRRVVAAFATDCFISSMG